MSHNILICKATVPYIINSANEEQLLAGSAFVSETLISSLANWRCTGQFLSLLGVQDESDFLALTY